MTVLVTGATDGVGKLVAERLAASGASVIVHGRNAKKGDEAVRDIRRSTGNAKVELRLADFASLADVRRLAHEITSEHERIQGLINNAGIGFGCVNTNGAR